MLRAQIHEPGVVRLDDVPEPVAGPRDAIVEVDACGICGSDVGYVRLGGVAGPTPEPMPLGHELSGVVVEVGAEATGIAVGSRVVVHPGAAGFAIGNGGPEGGFARKLLVRGAADGRSLFAVPDGMPAEIAALAEPLGVGMNAVDRSLAAPGDRVVVLGAGPIGLAAVATLADRGIEDVTAIDPSPKRREVARALGAQHGVDPTSEDPWEALVRLYGTTSFLGADYADANVFIEASGAPAVLRGVIERARPEARVSIVALHRTPIEVNFMLVMMKQLMLQGAMEYPERFEQMLDLLARRDLSPMITHRYPLESFLEAFEVASDPSQGAKVMIEIG